MDRRDIAYWTTTALCCLVLAFSGVGHTLKLDFLVESMTVLGYPAYFMTLIGVAKLLGVAALLVPGRPLLKEWAYAGLTFNLLGATASHAFAGDPFSHTVRPFLVLGLVVASYLTRPASRRLSGSPKVAGSGATGDALSAPAPGA